MRGWLIVIGWGGVGGLVVCVACGGVCVVVRCE